EYRAIEEGAAVGLRDQVDRGGRVRSRTLEVVAFQDVEQLDENDAARRGRRRADDGEAAVCPRDRLAIEHAVVGEILGGDQSPTLLDEIGELPRHGPGVEAVRFLLDALERARQLRLSEDVTLAP